MLNIIMLKNEFVQKERFDKWITLAHAHQRMDDGHLSQKRVVAKIKEHVGHKRTKQKGKIETIGLLPHEVIR
jgi:hypothetical protein